MDRAHQGQCAAGDQLWKGHIVKDMVLRDQCAAGKQPDWSVCSSANSQTGQSVAGQTARLVKL